MQRSDTDSEVRDPWVQKFLAHLATDRGASIYTQRNYRQALHEFQGWHQEARQQPPVWEKLQRDDFRGYLRFLGRPPSEQEVKTAREFLEEYPKALANDGVPAERRRPATWLAFCQALYASAEFLYVN